MLTQVRRRMQDRLEFEYHKAVHAEGIAGRRGARALSSDKCVTTDICTTTSTVSVACEVCVGKKVAAAAIEEERKPCSSPPVQSRLAHTTTNFVALHTMPIPLTT